MRISEQTFSERPRERCLQQGASALSLRECLALILGSGPPGKGCMGIAQEILARPGPGFSPTEEENAFFTAMESHASVALEEISGLGGAGRARILAALEIGRRYFVYREKMRRRLPEKKRRHRKEMPERAFDQIPEALRFKPQEWLGFVPLHRSGELGDFCLVETGVRTHVNIDPAELFSRLLALRPAAFYLFHNHPSGDMTPSPQDEELTRQVALLAAQLGIRLLGHGSVCSRGERWIVI